MTLRGWKEITNHTGLSIRTIKELMKRKKNPFPIIQVAGKYMTTRKNFAEWIEQEIQQKGG